MKDEVKAFKTEKLSFHPSSFILHPLFCRFSLFQIAFGVEDDVAAFLASARDADFPFDLSVGAYFGPCASGYFHKRAVAVIVLECVEGACAEFRRFRDADLVLLEE